MDFEELEIIDKIQLPNRALILVGITKSSSQLSLSIILKFFSLVYSLDLKPELLRHIESVLYKGRIGEAREILDMYVNKCLACKSFIKGDPTVLQCGHFFHKDCIIRCLRNCILNDINKVCPICNEEINNLGDIDQELLQLYEDSNLSKFLEQSSITWCPRCNEFYEIDEHDLITCKKCYLEFCSDCRNEQRVCTCNKKCFSCQQGETNYMCNKCKMS